MSGLLVRKPVQKSSRYPSTVEQKCSSHPQLRPPIYPLFLPMSMPPQGRNQLHIWNQSRLEVPKEPYQSVAPFSSHHMFRARSTTVLEFCPKPCPASVESRHPARQALLQRAFIVRRGRLRPVPQRPGSLVLWYVVTRSCSGDLLLLTSYSDTSLPFPRRTWSRRGTRRR